MNKIFIRGDTHGNFDFLEKFCCDNKTDLQDYLIILGDAGINYYMNKRDKKLKNKISNLPITLVCIHGNHEARPQNISSYILTSKAELNCNCWVEPEYPNILFPMDGLMTINDKNFLILGGAYSVDKEYRLKNGWNWFSDEQMSEDERNRILNLIEYLNHYDYILSHTAPISEEPTYLFLNFIDQSKVDKTMENFLEKVKNQITFTKWFFGHYHDDAILNDKFRIMFNDIIELDSF